MYTLRRISSKGVQMNFALGKSYTLIDRFASYEDFQNHFKKFFDRGHVADLDPSANDDTKRVYCFVGNEDGSDEHALWMGQQAYIMTESGATFSNLTMKG